MDYLHFQDDNDEDEDGIQSVSSEDSLERRNELEARLYSIIHHNDLSQSLPPDLSERFAVNYSENGEVIVSVNEDVDETERDVIFNKINLIKSCDQSIDSDSGDRGEEENKVTGKEKLKRRGEYKENVENISNAVKEVSNINSDKSKIRNTNVLQMCGINNSVKNKITNSSVLHGYESRIESSCMLRRSDWKTNAKMEYISFKSNFKDSAKAKISEVSCDTSIRKMTTDMPKMEMRTEITNREIITDTPKRKMMIESHKKELITDKPKREMITDSPKKEIMARQTQCQGGKLEFPNDNMDVSIHGVENRLRREQNTYDKLVCNPNVSKRKQIASYLKLKKLNKILTRMKERKMRKRDSTTAAGVDNEPPNFTKKSNPGSSACDSNHREVICMNLPAVSESNECVVLDSDNEVVELDSDLSGTKQNIQKLDASNLLDSVVCDSGDDIVCNFVNTPNKPCNESDVINLESSGDEQSELNNENNEKHFRHKKLSSLLDTPKKWTKRMIKFYCKTSKERRSFDCLKLIKDMRKTSSWSDWRISKDDLIGMKKNLPRCRRCREIGHVERKCKTAIRPPVCYMCGEPNHTAGRCPQAICLFCGRRTTFYTEKCVDCVLRLSAGQKCKICNGEHWMEVCPNLWRCYHLTTKEGPIVIPSEQKVNPRRYCWVCAGKGHFAHECDNPYYGSKEVQTTCFVTDYNEVNTLGEVREIVLSNNAQMKLNSNDGENFLQELCDRMKVRIDYVTGDGSPVIKVFGNTKESKIIRHEILKFVGEISMDQFTTVNQEINYDMHVTNNKGKNFVNNSVGQYYRKKSTLYTDIYRIMTHKNKAKKKRKNNKKKQKQTL